MAVELNGELTRVMALHALKYCKRLFYLEEVEEIRRADARVYAGRTLHEKLHLDDGEWQSTVLESEQLGLTGKVDYARYRDGGLVPFEHKRGRSRDGEAWPADELQIIAYAALLTEYTGRTIAEGRVHYHADNKTARIPIDSSAMHILSEALTEAAALRASTNRPPVAENPNLCKNCSLAPVCLPEEERFMVAEDDEARPGTEPERLFPADDDRLVLHVIEPGAKVSRRGEQVLVSPPEGDVAKFPARDIAAVVLHGNSQITTQTLHYAAAHDIAVHWVSGGGHYVGGVAPAGGVQRRIRQFKALVDDQFALRLARSLAHAKVENQLRFILRSGRNRADPVMVENTVTQMRDVLRKIERVADCDELRGCEGLAGRAYFAVLPALMQPAASHLMTFSGRNRRPPKDPFNAALSFGYSLLYRDVMTAILAVGLDPAFGFFHRPRSAAFPLALDLMELFRTTLWDMPLVASVNRNQWQSEHFEITSKQVWLSEAGRRLAIELYESRKLESWKHPVLQYSLSYGRAMELEVRLLEKEWSGKPGLFAKMRLRG